MGHDSGHHKCLVIMIYSDSVITHGITTKYAFLSRCKNFSADATIPNKKEVRMDEEAEFLQFYLHNSNSDNLL